MSKERIGLILIGLVGFALLGSGIMKLVSPDEGMQAMGAALTILAIVEFLIVAALVYAPTRLLGVLLAASYIGGIIAFSWLSMGETPLVGIIMNVLLYVGAALYRPSLTTG